MVDQIPAGAATEQLNFIYTNIGRGHAHYLDGIAEALVRQDAIGLPRRSVDVFGLSSFVPRQIWKTARWLYRKGASGGPVGAMYQRLRDSGDYNRRGLAMRLGARDIRRFCQSVTGPVVVAHPILVGMLRGQRGLIYQHGEMAVPPESLVRDAEAVLVPTAEAGAAFIEAGYSSDQVITTGLCIEPALVTQASESYQLRLSRLRSQQPLTGAFFSSGAEPRSHISKLVAAAESAVSSGGRVALFAEASGRFDAAATRLAQSSLATSLIVSARDRLPETLPSILILRFRNRAQLNRLTAQLFCEFDYLVAPSHERSNWAAGLGLPMFAIEPSIGSFAPRNRDILLKYGVARLIRSVAEGRAFGENLATLRQIGTLTEMARSGWGRCSIDGFDSIADWLIRRSQSFG